MSRKMLIKPFRSIESAATATHNWRRRQILRAGASTLVLGLAAPRLAFASLVLGVPDLVFSLDVDGDGRALTVRAFSASGKACLERC